MIVFVILFVFTFLFIKYGDVLWLLTIVPFYFFNMFFDYVPHDTAIYQRFVDYDGPPQLYMFLTTLAILIPIALIASAVRNS